MIYFNYKMNFIMAQKHTFVKKLFQNNTNRQS